MKGPVEIAPGVHGLGSELVNWYLVEDRGALTAVDAGLGGYRKTLEADLRAIGKTLADVSAVVLTHADADHTGIVPELKAGGARVLVHQDDEGLLRKPGFKGGDAKPLRTLPYLRRPASWRIVREFATSGGLRPPSVEGAETFSGGAVLDVPGRPRAVHTPGHTKGHCVLHFEAAGALFVGDALCSYNPLTGRRGAQLMPSPFNFDNAACLEALALIEPLEASVVLPGHGDPLTEGPAAVVAAVRRAGPS